MDVVAHTNLRMRGQAFVSFATKDIAAKAKKEVAGFPLYGKPMVSTHPLHWKLAMVAGVVWKPCSMDG